jgi:uncharacterized protein (TIGR00255 family)
MIQSMTGFARAEKRVKFGIFIVEIKTLNHKSLDITYKMSNGLAVFDERAKDLIKNKIGRGKVYLNVMHESAEGDTSHVVINEKLAKQYATKLKKLKRTLSLGDDINLKDIVSFPGVITYKMTQSDINKVWPVLKEVINSAIKKLIKAREREGSFLLKDFLKRIEKIRTITKNIKKNASANVRLYKKKLKDKIKELSDGYTMDRGRLEIEVALFAKNSDITEELTRLDSHIQNFSKIIKGRGEAGKKLDFISQELHREINTIGSKANAFNVSKGVIEIKTEIEKIREQLKNIE